MRQYWEFKAGPLAFTGILECEDKVAVSIFSSGAVIFSQKMTPDCQCEWEDTMYSYGKGRIWTEKTEGKIEVHFSFSLIHENTDFFMEDYVMIFNNDGGESAEAV